MPSFPQKEEGVVEQKVEEGLLLLRDNGEYLVLNMTGSMIWKLLDKYQSYTELIDDISSLENAPPFEDCKKQVEAFIDQLVDVGFLRRSVEEI